MNQMRVGFFIYSPFQAICAYEAIGTHHFDEVAIYCMGGLYNARNKKTPLLLDELGLEHFLINLRKSPWGILDAFRLAKKEGHFDCLYVGDYFDPTLRLLASLFLKRGGTIVYMDDGASTLSAVNIKHPLFKTSSFKVKVKYVLPAIISFLKKHQGRFFSIFNVNNGEKNDLSMIKTKFTSSTSSEQIVCMVGTTYKGFKSPQTFFQLLEETINRFVNNYDKVIYTPHRAAVDDDKIKDICQAHNIQYIEGDYCVEVDYIKKGYQPSLIIGFGSTALFTLKRIYPQAHVVSVKYPNVMVAGNERIYDIVNDNLTREGIEVVTVL